MSLTEPTELRKECRVFRISIPISKHRNGSINPRSSCSPCCILTNLQTVSTSKNSDCFTPAGAVLCFACCISSNAKSQLSFETGFSDWKHAIERMKGRRKCQTSQKNYAGLHNTCFSQQENRFRTPKATSYWTSSKNGCVCCQVFGREWIDS